MVMSDRRLSVVASDAQFGSYLAEQLSMHDFVVTRVAALTTLLAQLPHQRSDAVMLVDLEPDCSRQTLRDIRDVSTVPCIVLFSRILDFDYVSTIDAGADDVMPRDMPVRALVARLRGLLRRIDWERRQHGPSLSPITQGGWHLNVARRQLQRPDGSDCCLTAAEFDLLRLLMEARGTPIARDTISQVVLRRQLNADDRTVDNLVSRVRRKLGAGQHQAIKSIRTAGYAFAEFAELQTAAA